MAFPVAAAIGAGASLLGGLFGNSAKSKEAAKDRAFQLQMAQNAHQYEVEDLRKAGLNPILSGTGGPGARASGGSRADQSDVVTPAVNSALAVARQQQELENLKATEELTQAQKNKTLAETQNLAPEYARLWEQVNLTTQQVTKVRAEIENLSAQLQTELERKMLVINQAKQAGEQARLHAAEADLKRWLLDHGAPQAAAVLGVAGSAAGLVNSAKSIFSKPARKGIPFKR